MTLTDAAKIFSMKPTAIRALKAKGVFWSNWDSELSGEELTMLKGIAQIWGSEFFLRKQLADFSKKKRADLVRRVGLTKPEIFMYSRFLKAKLANPPEVLSVHQVASEAMVFLGIPDDKPATTLRMVKTARRMRQKAYYEIRKIRAEKDI